ncbi:24013_t:CDS:2 [Racocetra persica]|uniref:24013_t:CDS:1 n=1 Tax=Racocetra persica TaxID=160502 RepID=A0ACA9NNZ0_9GLOM|nr:24013_t:CDS:2 [Racocetra persica]
MPKAFVDKLNRFIEKLSNLYFSDINSEKKQLLGIINNISLQLSDITIPINVEPQYNNGELISLKISLESNDSNNQTLVVKTNKYSEDEYELSDNKLKESKRFCYKKF